MERKILFKGKRLSDSTWVEGYYRGNKDGQAFITRKDGTPLTFEVDPSTVCQFTGLRDSKGVDIFEGDILAITSCCTIDEILDASIEEAKERFMGIVTWDKFRYVLESTPQYTEKYRKEKWDCLNMLTDDGWHSTSLVCGNKFDRKEGEK